MIASILAATADEIGYVYGSYALVVGSLDRLRRVHHRAGSGRGPPGATRGSAVDVTT
jgi:hypothetical protein